MMIEVTTKNGVILSINSKYIITIIKKENYTVISVFAGNEVDDFSVIESYEKVMKDIESRNDHCN